MSPPYKGVVKMTGRGTARPFFPLSRNEMKHELKQMMRAYENYLSSVSRFIEATDEDERYKLIAFDIIERQSLELEENLNAANEVLTQYINEQG